MASMLFSAEQRSKKLKVILSVFPVTVLSTKAFKEETTCELRYQSLKLHVRFEKQNFSFLIEMLFMAQICRCI